MREPARLQSVSSLPIPGARRAPMASGSMQRLPSLGQYTRCMDPLAIGARRAPGMGNEDTLCSRAGCSFGPRKSQFCRSSRVARLPHGVSRSRGAKGAPFPSRLRRRHEVAALRSFGGEETCRRLVSSMICGIRSEGAARPLGSDGASIFSHSGRSTSKDAKGKGRAAPSERMPQIQN
jgi:hypothetical protein